MGRRAPHYITEQLTPLNRAITMLTNMSPMHALRCTHGGGGDRRTHT